MRPIALIVLLVVTVTAPAHAQFTEVQPGVRVRLEAPGIVAGRYVATVLSRTADSIIVGMPNATPVRVPIASITGIEISRGSSRMVGAQRGIVWGVPIGLAAGLLTYAATPACTRCNPDDLNPHSGAFIVWSAVSGVVYGAAIGALVGREKWERFDTRSRAAFEVRSGRLLVGLSLRQR